LQNTIVASIPAVYQTQFSKRKGKYLSGSLGFNGRGRFIGGFARNQVLALLTRWSMPLNPGRSSTLSSWQAATATIKRQP
jgi:hypothetical protein